MSKLNKILAVLLVSSLATTTVHAHPFFGGLLRVFLTNTAKKTATTAVKHGVKQSIKTNGKKGLMKRLSKTLVINGVSMVAVSAYAKEQDFEYNQHGAKYQETVGGTEETIYLGKSCDVESPVYGKGVWTWDNKGWYIMMNDENETIFSYPLSELPNFSSKVLESCKLRNVS